MVSFVQISSPRDQSPGLPSPALSINAVGSFSPNKQVFLPKKIGGTIGCRDVSWDLHLRHALHFSGFALSLDWVLVASDEVIAALLSEGPLNCINPARGYPALLKASFISVGSLSWMLLSDHLSPLASSSGETCGFDIMYRCDLGEGKLGCGLAHISWTQKQGDHPLSGPLGKSGGGKTNRQPQPL